MSPFLSPLVQWRSLARLSKLTIRNLKLTTYAGGGFWYNPGVGQKNWAFAGWEAQYDFSEVLTLGGEVFYQTADSQDSDRGGGFNFGGFINLNDNSHILISLGHSISGAATITGYIGYQLTI